MTKCSDAQAAKNSKRQYHLQVQLEQPNSLDILQVYWLDFAKTDLHIIPNDECASITVIFDNRRRAQSRRSSNLYRYVLGILAAKLATSLLRHMLASLGLHEAWQRRLSTLIFGIRGEFFAVRRERWRSQRRYIVGFGVEFHISCCTFHTPPAPRCSTSKNFP